MSERLNSNLRKVHYSLETNDTTKHPALIGITINSKELVALATGSKFMPEVYLQSKTTETRFSHERPR